MSGPRTLLIGPGAVGGFLATRLTAAGWPVAVLATGATAQELRAGPVTVIDGDAPLSAQLRIVAEPEESGPVEIVLVCVKSTATAEVARVLSGWLPAGAIVLSMQNGVENPHILAAAAPQAVVAGVAMYVGIERRSPREIIRRQSRSPGGRLLDRFVVGPPGPAAVALRAVGAATGVPVQVIDHPEAALWQKLVANVCINTVTALGRARVGAIFSDPRAVELMLTLGDEVERVAAAAGVPLPRRAGARYVAEARHRLPAAGGSSTLFDLEQGRPLEHDALVGAVVRAGERLGVAVPVSRACHTLLGLLDPSARTGA